MRQTTDKARAGIWLTLFRSLNDLDFADDIVLISQRQTDMQAKTTDMAEKAWTIGLKVSNEKEQ